MTDDAPHFDDRGRLFAPRYGDVYFSAEDGLAETRHVFLDGNRLAERFGAMRPGTCFTIGETGFGTGLNFLAAWQLFEQYAPADASLEFVSVEGLPLGVETMRRALSPWPGLEGYCESLIEQWGPLWPGMHRLRFADGCVRLALLIGEAADALATIDAQVDAWFLDGFAPSRNPEMWSEAVFAQVARLSAPGSTLATYTAAGFVRRGLGAVGFEIQKQPGFGTKRDMTAGRMVGEANTTDQPASVLVIGGSLAGAFVARSLAERGLAVSVIERQRLIDGELPTLAPRAAVLQPKINDASDPAGGWLREGYAFVERWLSADSALADSSAWSDCGSFQAAHDDRTERRLRRFVEQFGCRGLCRWIESRQTEGEVGLALEVGGVVVERAGVLRPAGLCKALLDHPRITVLDGLAVGALERKAGGCWQVSLDHGEPLSATDVVIANARGALQFTLTTHLKLQPVRGQVTVLGTGDQAGWLSGLNRALFYGGYLLPGVGGTQALGASFVPGDASLDWRAAEHADCCDKLARVLPDEATRLRTLSEPSGWVGLRVTTPQHRGIAEAIETGLYVSLGHGSHGIASAAHAGEHIASLITGGMRQRATR